MRERHRNDRESLSSRPLLHSALGQSTLCPDSETVTHPDDPALSPIRGVGRIMRSVSNFQRLVDLAPSPVNGITLRQGNFRLMTSEV